jgi:hypothetical protein
MREDYSKPGEAKTLKLFDSRPFARQSRCAPAFSGAGFKKHLMILSFGTD